MEFYVIGDDKSLQNVTDIVLALTGGMMKGNIGFDSGVRASDVIRFIKGDDMGGGVAIGDGGTTVIGGGESAAIMQPAAGNAAAQEKLILCNDNAIEFYVNCQNGAENAVRVVLDTNGMLSGHQKAITSGTAAPSGGANGDIYIQY